MDREALELLYELHINTPRVPVRHLCVMLVDASGTGDLDEMRNIMKHGQDPNIRVPAPDEYDPDYEVTALCIAVQANQVDAIRVLLSHGADPNLADTDGETPLMMAAQEGYLQAGRLLVSKGAKLDATRPDRGSTAFHTACISDQPAFVALLKELGCDTTRKTKDGETGEQLAKRKGNRKVLEQLRTAQ